ncbi:MAG: hypothetical protein Q4G68_06075 [Planctomycetia bacterium]|nr:hypothetical protein [Planctomycetia bacterium]
MACMKMNTFRPFSLVFLFVCLFAPGLFGCRSVSKDGYPFLGGLGELAWTDESLEKDWNRARASAKKRKSVKKAKEEQNQQILSAVDYKFYPVDYYCSSGSPYRLLFDAPRRDNLLTVQEGPARSGRCAPVPNASSDPELEYLLSGMQRSTAAKSVIGQGVSSVPEPAVRRAATVMPLPKESDNPIRQVQYIDAVRTAPELTNVPAQTDKNWEEQTRQAIDTLQKELQSRQADGSITASEQAKLRLLRLTLGETNEATPIACENESLHRFWEEQCSGLAAVLHGNLLDTPENPQTAATAAQHFQVGLDSLKQNCPLTLNKSLIVETVAPFGLYEEKKDATKAGEPIYVYAELENVFAKETSGGVEMAVLCRWELLDKSHQAVIPACEQLCRSLTESRLRDIVLNITVETESTLAPGEYTLVLAVSDRNHPQPTTVQATLPVRITP